MQTALITGGAGFIGSALCKRLLEQNFKVICVDNFSTGSKDNLQDFLDKPGFSLIEEDIVKLISFPGVDFVFHLASPASPNKKSPRSYMSLPVETLLANSVGTYNALNIAKKNGAKFLYASSSEVYGDPSISPQAESYFGNVNPAGPRSVYDEGKRFGEAMVMAYVRKEGLDARIIRIFNTYGPNMQVDDGRVVSNFIVQAIKGEDITIYGDGSQTRSFCFITDMVDGLSSAMFSDKTTGEIINIGNPNERTIKELANTIKNLLRSTSEVVFEDLPEDDPKRRCPDITKAKKILLWEPEVPLDEGLGKTAEYFKGVLK